MAKRDAENMAIQKLIELVEWLGEDPDNIYHLPIPQLVAMRQILGNGKPPTVLKIGDPIHVVVKRPCQPRLPGYIIGSYIPRDGRHQGWVVEHERDGIVHVYPDAALAPGLE